MLFTASNGLIKLYRRSILIPLKSINYCNYCIQAMMHAIAWLWDSSFHNYRRIDNLEYTTSEKVNNLDYLYFFLLINQ